ncbi:hypothetical protein MMC18_002435 [Xylographa bjoerkii]|nr:hypothetical protein [Xylographa bjoerkii]
MFNLLRTAKKMREQERWSQAQDRNRRIERGTAADIAYANEQYARENAHHFHAGPAGHHQDRHSGPSSHHSGGGSHHSGGAGPGPSPPNNFGWPPNAPLRGRNKMAYERNKAAFEGAGAGGGAEDGVAVGEEAGGHGAGLNPRYTGVGTKYDRGHSFGQGPAPPGFDPRGRKQRRPWVIYQEEEEEYRENGNVKSGYREGGQREQPEALRLERGEVERAKAQSVTLT